MANQIMVEKQGVALRLLHQIKQSLQSLQQNAFSTSSKVLGFDPEQTQSTKETGSAAYLSSQKSLGKTRYEDIEKSRFDDRMRKMVPNSYEQKLASHLKKFQDHADDVATENYELQERTTHVIVKSVLTDDRECSIGTSRTSSSVRNGSRKGWQCIVLTCQTGELRTNASGRCYCCRRKFN